MYIQHLLATQLSPAIIINGVKHILSKFKIYWRYSYPISPIAWQTKSLSKRKLTIFQNSRHIGDTVITKATYTAANHQKEQVLATQFSPSQQCHYTSSYSDHRSISPIFRSETLELYSSWLLSLLRLITGYNYINNKMATFKFVESHVAF
jgi:hypothetical protein